MHAARFTSVLTIGLGSALGGMTRYGCALLFEQWLGAGFPWGTLFVNVTGSFAIGFLFALTAADGHWPVTDEWRLFAMAGFCGGYTTFSSFSLQTHALGRERAWAAVAANVGGSVVLCLLAVWLGTECAGWLGRR